MVANVVEQKSTTMIVADSSGTIHLECPPYLQRTFRAYENLGTSGAILEIVGWYLLSFIWSNLRQCFRACQGTYTCISSGTRKTQQLGSSCESVRVLAVSLMSGFCVDVMFADVFGAPPPTNTTFRRRHCAICFCEHVKRNQFCLLTRCIRTYFSTYRMDVPCCHVCKHICEHVRSRAMLSSFTRQGKTPGLCTPTEPY
jgi:hypothetical protein